MVAELLSPRQLLVFPCTNSGYGVGQADLHCDEETPLHPVSLYGRLKVDIERWLLDRGQCVTFRFATASLRQSAHATGSVVLNEFTYRAVTDRFIVLLKAHFKRNYLHVRDAARAFIHALSHYEAMRGDPLTWG